MAKIQCRLLILLCSAFCVDCGTSDPFERIVSFPHEVSGMLSAGDFAYIEGYYRNEIKNYRFDIQSNKIELMQNDNDIELSSHEYLDRLVRCGDKTYCSADNEQGFLFEVYCDISDNEDTKISNGSIKLWDPNGEVLWSGTLPSPLNHCDRDFAMYIDDAHLWIFFGWYEVHPEWIFDGYMHENCANIWKISLQDGTLQSIPLPDHIECGLTVESEGEGEGMYGKGGEHGVFIFRDPSEGVRYMFTLFGDGILRAFNADTAEMLWEYSVGLDLWEYAFIEINHRIYMSIVERDSRNVRILDLLAGPPDAVEVVVRGGATISGEYGLVPMANAHVLVSGYETKTDTNGEFLITIPLSGQLDIAAMCLACDRACCEREDPIASFYFGRGRIEWVTNEAHVNIISHYQDLEGH